MNPSSLFSPDYFEARDRFRAQAAHRGFTLTTYAHPTARGPQGETLSTDLATWGPEDAGAALLVISGTHGVEGYAGSAIQLGFMGEMEPASWPQDLRVILIHALNPYGFAWNRRVTEENVDLNRNFINHGADTPSNDHYDEFRDAIAPPDLSPQTLDAASRTLRNFAKEHGAFAMQEMISKGQYRHPDGVYYGGRREQWSAGLFRHIVTREMSRCRRAAIVDIHTGLGAYGEAELISEEAPTSSGYLRARQWWGDTVRSTLAGESVSAQVSGSLDSAVPVLLAHANPTMICLEYGTCSTLEVFQALRADNWLHAHGDPQGPQAPEIRAQLRQAFYPDQDDWKEKVWTRGRAVLAQSISGLTEDAGSRAQVVLG